MPRAPLDRAFDAQQLTLLADLGRAAQVHGAKIWVVGGAVRDAYLGVPVSDIDLTSDVPAEQLGRSLAGELGGILTNVTRFGTAKLRLRGHSFDLATTRTETYPTPATLPEVAFGAIEQDLARRDFTVNAMAVSLGPDDFGEVLDPHGGHRDVDARLVRVLHSQSFRDDPTRAFRAVRYAVRLGFHIERRTAAWIRRDAHYIDGLTAARIRHEIERMLDEPLGATMLAAAQRRGLLGIVNPALGAPEVMLSLQRARGAALKGLALLGALLYSLSSYDAGAVASRLALSKKQEAVALAAPRLRYSEPNIRQGSPSDIDALAGSAPADALRAAAVVGSDVQARRAIGRYLNRLAVAGAHLKGEDLLALGVPQGPAMGIVLRSLRAAELDGRVKNKTAAVHLVQKLIEE